ncbi:MAG: M3 family oligoendopeptidase [Anaerolineae bacterium]|jgi:pepF/M3 family oligoendopeptidase|nr:M3 family oligoendopeptidase [Anaerolineae bacterium]MBT7069861.1 M3 family oligoendopeptidase [Anaerolineae bacterium]MBT7988906.1 M3 family oligoendopeptidase [Anaerolineae bacterium]
MKKTTPPHWDLSNVYPGLDSPEFNAGLKKLSTQIDDFETFFSNKISQNTPDSSVADLAALAEELITRFNKSYDLAETLGAFIYSFITTDSFDQLAKKILSQFEQTEVRLRMLGIQAKEWIGSVAHLLPEIIENSTSASEHAFFLQETAEQSQYLMNSDEEALAAELSLSGTSGWEKLQGTVTSQMKINFELDGEMQELSSPALINLHSHPDEDVRKRAYEAEMEAWEAVKEPLAASMNGIKGTVNTLNKRRGREDALHASIDAARMDRASLEAMLEAMKDSFPMFQRYFLAKAKRLGKKKLPWWDVFAPVGDSNKTYSYQEASEFILEQFGGFSPKLKDLAQRAFSENWIDAEQRVGKRGGAFCMGVPNVRESRILSNFDGTFDQLSTLAHELGHAFHNECIYSAGKTALQGDTPMTLAETASIMCETVVVNAVLAQTTDPAEELSILETSLLGASQVIVDIYSRYLFEKEVFERRADAELSAEDLCEIMERAQKATYGDGLDERYLHKYMWTWKPHYYSAGLSFYNFPYAFGLLFATGLYAIYEQRGDEFIPDYINLLASTGEGRAAELADRFGINIREKKFWEDSLKVIEKQVDRYCQL